MPPPDNNRELQAFLGIFIYLGNVFPSTAIVCDPLQKLISSKVAWTWNASYQSLFVKTKLLIKADVHEIYDDSKPLYLETDTSGVGLELPFSRHRKVQCARKTLCQTALYSNP